MLNDYEELKFAQSKGWITRAEFFTKEQELIEGFRQKVGLQKDKPEETHKHKMFYKDGKEYSEEDYQKVKDAGN